MFEQIAKLISDVKEDENLSSQLTPESDIINEIGLDSLQMVDFLLMIEDEFNVDLDIQSLDFNKMKSIQSFMTFIAECKMKTVIDDNPAASDKS